MTTPATKWQKEFIRENAQLLTDLQIAATLSRVTGQLFTEQRVQLLRIRMGISKEETKGCDAKPRKIRRD